ncbi:MAG: hypothetical protein SNI42_06740 [Rikenellaceae bacterium]
MDFFVTRFGVSNAQLWIYNIFLIVYFVYLFQKYNKSNVAQYIIFLFTVGIAADMGRLLSLGNTASHIYLLTSAIWGIFLLHKYGFTIRRGILFSYIIYIIYFVTCSIIIHKDNALLVTSQSFKYTVPLIVFFVVDAYIVASKRKGVILIHKVLNDIIIAQILFCLFKLCVLQATQEGLVGSLTGRDGGGAGTSFPLLCMLWLAFVSKMKFSRKFWYYTLGFIFIGFMTGKRAIWLVFPLEFIVLYIYYRAKDISSLIKYIVPALLIVCGFLYFGVKLSPTLNPDKKVWGRFDLEYTYSYIISYSGGSETSAGKTSINEGDGRLGAALLLWNDVTDVVNYDKQVLLGVGNEQIKYYDRENYSDRDTNLGVSYRGGITGIVFMYFISGILGVILFFIYLYNMFVQSSKSKIVWIVFGITMFDFIFYNGQIINNVPMMSMLFLLILICRIGVYNKIKIYNESVNCSKQ